MNIVYLVLSLDYFTVMHRRNGYHFRVVSVTLSMRLSPRRAAKVLCLHIPSRLCFEQDNFPWLAH